MRNFRAKTAGLVMLTAVIAACTSFAGEEKVPNGLLKSPPTEHAGLSVSGSDSLKLGEQIPALAGYQVRVRTVTMKPGGVVKQHGHETRPGAFYIVKGNVTELRGEKHVPLKPGQVVLEDHHTSHWVINNSKEDAVLFVFDIVPVE